MPNTVTVNGVTYTDDDNATTGLANGGHRTRLVPMFGNAVTDIAAKAALATSNGAAQVTLAADQVALAAAQAVIATDKAALTAADRVQTGLDVISTAASAASAAAIAGAFVGTSTSSLLIATGSKSFATQTAEQYTPGVFLNAVSAANNANFMFGQVTSYDAATGALVLDIQVIGGAGTFADWNISLVGARGPAGAGVQEQVVGFTVTAGATPKTLTVDDNISVSNILAGMYGGSSIVRSARTANTILGTADKGTLIDITSGTFTQTFDAAATLASGWFVYLRNSGTGGITLDPNAAELIDGLTSYVMYPGECRLVQCDGAAFTSVVLSAFSATFTASGTFVKPPGYGNFSGFLWGGGGAGSLDAAGPFGSGGGGAACTPFTLPASFFGTSETVTIAAGGLHTSGSGGNGGTSSIGALVYGYGGGGALTGASTGGGGGGIDSAGSGTTAGTGFTGFAGGSSGSSSAYGGGGGGGNSTGGKSIFGGGGGGFWSGTAGGVSKFGGSGGAGSNSGAASNGQAPGGGGGGSASGTSGDGARGELRIRGTI